MCKILVVMYMLAKNKISRALNNHFQSHSFIVQILRVNQYIYLEKLLCMQ